MAKSYGSGVSRTLAATDRLFKTLITQPDKPLLDSEVNLLSDMHEEDMRLALQSMMPSGFLMDPTRALDDYLTDPQFSNLFVLGNTKSGETQPAIWAVINGWVLPIAGTDFNGVRNNIRLYPPPATDTRVDLVFLEAWQTVISPNPATTSKPTASTIWKYGNVKFGGTNLADDIEDPSLGEESTERAQVQYRLRVFGSGSGLGAGSALDVYPDGLEDTNVKGQGAAAAPVAAFAYTNMRQTLGDPGLWRAGDGDPLNLLKTTDGYTYAIPVCAVFRRNSNVYVSLINAGNPNQNGAFNRNPGAQVLADPLQGAKELTVPTLRVALTPTATGVAVTLDNLAGSGLDNASLVLASTFLVIDNEIMGISAVNVAGGTVTISGRGRYGSAAVGHVAGSKIKFFNSRPDGLFADQIAATDILDLRRAINPGDWDYQRLLMHNVVALAKGDLRSTWKRAGVGDTQGTLVHEVDYLQADGQVANPNHSEALDGPDGIRTVWSDAAVIQPDVTVLLGNQATVNNNSVGITTADQFDTLTEWDVGADFKPVGFLNYGNGGLTEAFTNGSTVLLFIGGATGGEGARGTFRDGNTRAVRFVMPREYWKDGFPTPNSSIGNQYPFQLRFLKTRAHEPVPQINVAYQNYAAQHPGAMYPWRDLNFERPFIVLGGLLNSTLRFTGVLATKFSTVGGKVNLDLGQNFDTLGVLLSKNAQGQIEDDPAKVSKPLLRGQRTLYGMLTDGGRDLSGNSSEVYLVIHGDKFSTNNNGAFKVIGAGTAAAGYTTNNAANATSVVLQPLSADFAQIDPASTATSIIVEFRSQHHNSEDTSDYAARIADLAVVLTDIGGLDNHPWKSTSLSGVENDNRFTISGVTGKVAVVEKCLLSTTLLYHPGRGGAMRVPDEVVRFATRTGNESYLTLPKSTVDTTFAAAAGTPVGEREFHLAHVQTWNRLPGLGWNAPTAPNYGGNVVGFTEQDRESEVFYDKGSKTFVFRPFRWRDMTLQAHTYGNVTGGGCLLGPYTYPDGGATPKDSLQILTGTNTTGKLMGFPVPREYMPRFGRQDIPFRRDTQAGQGTFLSGINHLFRDGINATNPVFTIIGGSDNASGGNQVNPLWFATGTATAYAKSATLLGTVNNKPHYGARRTTDINPNTANAPAIIAALKAVNSSDLGRGLKGIQFPPYLGPARIYGVYELENYKAKGGRTFLADRFTLEQDPATNLLREDAWQQTLFILQNGAQDWTGDADDHTYILPSNALDLSRIPTFVAGNTFETFHYVVECVVFAFSKGWINKNNYVLCRKHNGRGALATDGTDLELQSLPMVIPCPASLNEQTYVAYNRVPYQGDPYMSRAGANRTLSDYEDRYGQIPMASQNALRTAIQQFDTNGVFVPEKPNARAFEVLAAVDFYTTLGTGKIGGKVYPGTVLDVGLTEDTASAASRMPLATTTPAWRVLTRAFTEGQKENTNRAEVALDLLLTTNLFGSTALTFTAPDGTTATMTAQAPATYVSGTEGHFEVAQETAPPWGVANALSKTLNLDFLGVVIAADASATIAVAMPGVTAGQSVHVVASALPNGFVVDGYATGGVGTEVTVRVRNTKAVAGVALNVLTVVITVFTLGTQSREATASNLANRVNAHTTLKKIIKAYSVGTRVVFQAVQTGKEGNKIKVSMSHPSVDVHTLVKLEIPQPNAWTVGSKTASTYFLGGEDLPVNAGDGVSQLQLTGMTERLPLGILLQDSDFLCENPLGDKASSMKVSLAGLHPIQSILPLTLNGDEYSRVLGAPGEMIAMADGGILLYTAWTDANGAGSRKFRLYRGGGSAYVLSGDAPGGPVDWVSDTFPKSVKPVLKGGVLACRAMLVRNFYETPFAPATKVSDGDEIQMVILTQGILGNGKTVEEGVNLTGSISPSGYGEGYAAADRYRLMGKPMYRAFSRQVKDPSTVVLAVYPEDERTK